LEDGLLGIFATWHRADWSIDILAAYSGADDLTGRAGSSKGIILDADQFLRFDRSSYVNSYVRHVWDYYYRTILACNSFLAYANSPEIDVAVLNNARANAYFIRGMLYFRLATMFKDIPMPLVPAPDATLNKTPMRKVIEQSIQDLSYAAEWANGVRDTNPTIPDGHVTKTAAKAFLAKSYLQLTGWPFYETDKWEKIKELTQSIINDDVYSLMDDYASCFQDPYQMNKEMIFANICTRGEYPQKAESRYYGYKWSWWGDCFIENSFAPKFPEGYRKAFSMVSIEDTVRNTTVTNYYQPLLETWSHAMVTKFSYGTINDTPEFEHSWQTSNDIPVMRFAEVVLMHAEACANLGDINEAIEKLNWVKRRAFAKGYYYQKDVASLPARFWMEKDDEIDYTSEDISTKEAIVNERSFEFLGEPGGVYWLDLIRLEKVAEANANRDEGDTKIFNDPSDPQYWFFPIPYYEREANPNLK
jgi:hypothetical protein